jgi:hypothetical protein
MHDGKRNGVGQTKFHDGTIYQGQWKDDKFYGQGRLIAKNGDETRGSWLNNIADGPQYFSKSMRVPEPQDVFESPELVSGWGRHAYSALDQENKGYLLKNEVLDPIIKSGVIGDGKLKDLIEYIEHSVLNDGKITLDEWEGSILPKSNFIKRVLESQLVIPEWETFC